MITVNKADAFKAKIQMGMIQKKSEHTIELINNLTKNLVSVECDLVFFQNQSIVVSAEDNKKLQTNILESEAKKKHLEDVIRSCREKLAQYQNEEEQTSVN